MSEKNCCCKWGFDSTSFRNIGQFKKVLEDNNLTDFTEVTKDKGTEFERKRFLWTNGDGNVTLVTEYNPITGEHGMYRRQNAPIGYAGYIGITGNPETVEKLAKSIKKRTRNIKDESPCEREYI